jgi:hypothetical protein
MLIALKKCERMAVSIAGRRSRSTACHLDDVFETRVLFRMMGKAKNVTRMRLALLNAKHKTLFIKRGDVGERSRNQHLYLRRSS